MFGPWIWKKINEILKSHAQHIYMYVAYESVGLSIGSHRFKCASSLTLWPMNKGVKFHIKKYLI